jgi:hypothetical protein
VIRALNYERRAKALAKPAQKVLLATPTRGGLSPCYAASIYQLLGDESLDIDQSFEIADVQMWHEDVVRVRSRFVNYFLNETDATHLLFVDSDVSFLPKVVRGMLNAKKDFVAAPYPRRDKIDFETVRSHADIPPEAAAYRYSVVPLEGEGITIEADGSGCAEVSKVALGCSLISRPLLEAMVEHFAGDRLDYADLIESWAEKDWSPPLPESKKSIESLLRRVATMAREHPILTYYDELPYLHGARVETTALFQLLLRDGALLSEDYSFCERAREMGAKVWIYLGDGSPVDHVGDFTFKGALEGFGFKRG